MDWWVAGALNLTATACDGAGLCAAANVTVAVGRGASPTSVRVTALAVAPGAPPALAVNGSGSAFLSSSPAAAVFLAGGGSAPSQRVVLLSGRGFGPAPGRVTGAEPYNFTAKYSAGGAAAVFSAPGPCALLAAYALLACPFAAGVGDDLAWTVTVTGADGVATASPPSAALAAYFPPVIQAVARAGGKRLRPRGERKRSQSFLWPRALLGATTV